MANLTRVTAPVAGALIAGTILNRTISNGSERRPESALPGSPSPVSRPIAPPPTVKVAHASPVEATAGPSQPTPPSQTPIGKIIVGGISPIGFFALGGQALRAGLSQLQEGKRLSQIRMQHPWPGFTGNALANIGYFGCITGGREVGEYLGKRYDMTPKQVGVTSWLIGTGFGIFFITAGEYASVRKQVGVGGAIDMSKVLKGFAATLSRELKFIAAYNASGPIGKQVKAYNSESPLPIVGASIRGHEQLASDLVVGFVAGLVTNPDDTIKTWVQSGKFSGEWAAMKHITEKGLWTALHTSKAIPRGVYVACAIAGINAVTPVVAGALDTAGESLRRG